MKAIVAKTITLILNICVCLWMVLFFGPFLIIGSIFDGVGRTCDWAIREAEKENS